MAVKNRTTLQAQKDIIKGETIPNANTANRNGQMIEDQNDSFLTIQDDIIDSLEYTSTLKALSANQGKILNTKFLAIPIFQPVATISALKAIDTSSFTSQNLWLINVGTVSGLTSGGIYDYIRTAIDTEDLPNIVQPTTGVGRWRLKGGSGTVVVTGLFDNTFDNTFQ